MEFTKSEFKFYAVAVEAYIEQLRPPKELRNKIDISYLIENQSVEIFEIRPHFIRSNKKIENAVAKTTYDKNKNIWKIYRHTGDFQWNTYEPKPEVNTLVAFLDIVKEDEHGYFWG